jgi:putative ABC transport system permease protein
VTTEVAEQRFGKGVKAVGQCIYVNNRDFTICGVVETPSSLTEKCVADIWCPFKARGLFDNLNIIGKDGKVVSGEYNINLDLNVAFAVPADKRDAFMQELKEVEARYNSMHKDKPVDMTAYLETHYSLVWKGLGSMFQVWDGNLFWYVVPSILLLLLVPALNLSGLVAARMKRRLPEMGVRKAFGAKKRELMHQIISENLVLTLCGGLVGLVITWLLLYVFRSWAFFALGNIPNQTVEPLVQGEMLFSPLIFLIAFLVCAVVNLMATLIPAGLSLRNPIVESMNQKK